MLAACFFTLIMSLFPNNLWDSVKNLRQRLAVIMRHMARFCMSVERARAGDPTSWIGVRPLAV